MKETPESPNPKTHQGWTKRHLVPAIIPALLLVYQLAALIVCVCVILRAWPDNRWARNIVTNNQGAEFTIAVTRDRLELLTQSKAVLSRWLTEGGNEITGA